MINHYIATRQRVDLWSAPAGAYAPAMDDNQQRMLEEVQVKLASQQKEIDELRASRKKGTHWRALLAVGAVLILVSGIAAYAYNRLLESIIPL